MCFNLFRSPLAVEKELSAGLYIVYYLIVLEDIRRIVAGNKICLGYIVRGLDRLITESEVRNGNAAGLLGVVLEVSLDKLICVVTDDLDGVLVSTNGSVAAESPELAADCSFGSCIGSGLFFERVVSNVINDTDCEVCLRLSLSEVFKYCENRCGRSILRTETVTSADNLYAAYAHNIKSGNNVEVKRFAERAGFLCSVKYSYLLCCLRKNSNKLFRNKRSVKSYLDKTNLFALSHEVINNFLSNVADRAHSYDYSFCIGSAVVVEEFIIGTDFSVNLVHVIFNDCRKCFIVLVAGFSVLEEDIAVFSGTTEYRLFRIECSCTESGDSVFVHHACEFIVIPYFDFLDFMRSTETVKEVDERNSALNC